MKLRQISWPLLAGLILIVPALVGCGASLPAGSLPTLPPTTTAVAHATATFPVLPTAEPLAALDWSDTARFRQAMRSEFAGDIDLFANRNRYYIEATLDLADVVTIVGAQRVLFTNRYQDTIDDIVFRLYPNLDAFSGRVNILGTTAAGVEVDPQLEAQDSVLRIPLPQALQPGESVEVTVEFNSAIEAGFTASYGEYSFQRGVFTAPEWYPVLSVYEEGRGWWVDRARNIQGEQTYTETGLYEVRLTADDDVSVIMSGTEIETLDNGDSTLTHHVVSGPMRDNILVASRSLIKIEGEVDGIALNVYYWDDPDQLKRNETAAAKGLQILADSMQVFNSTFGEYPFSEFDMIQTNTGAGGIEYPGLIVVADRYWNVGDNFFEVVVVHEAAHQWWYSLVGNNQVSFPFLDESLTSFSEYVYFWNMAETDRQVQEASDYIRNEQRQVNNYLGQGNPDLPLGLSTDGYVAFQYGLIIYTKGPLFFNEITNVIGRDEMYRVLKEYFRRYRYEVATIAGMMETFEDVTGRDWDQMFYEWVGQFSGLDPAAVSTVNALNSSG